MKSATEIDVTKLPFNYFIGLKISNKSGYLLMLDNRAEYRNHLDTVHASALFALAEATSGHFLLNEFLHASGLQCKRIIVGNRLEKIYIKENGNEVFIWS